MEFKDYYAILGVESNADLKAIKTAYRRLARKYHPDVSKEADAEKKFKEVAEAYEVLKDSDKRAEYDQIRQYGNGHHFDAPPGWQPSGNYDHHGDFDHRDFSDFFESIFGSSARATSQQHQSRVRKGNDVEMELPVFLEEIQTDHQRTLNYRLPRYDEFGRKIEEIDKKVNVKIPAGIRDGERIRLKGQGSMGLNGGENGDLYLIIRYAPHPLFDVQGHDLIITVPIAPWEAILGKKIVIPTLSGKINISVPANSQTGQRLRLKGKGIKSKKATGDLYAVLKVVLPDRETNEKTKQLWQQLSEQAIFNPRADWE